MGAVLAHLMFGLRWYSLSTHVRSGWPLVSKRIRCHVRLVIRDLGLQPHKTQRDAIRRQRPTSLRRYWFTASTSFANPAVTVARALSDTFAGIRPADVPLFVAAQIAGALAATFLFRWLVPGLRANAKAVLVAHETAKPAE